jgi:hypothetical protein
MTTSTNRQKKPTGCGGKHSAPGAKLALERGVLTWMIPRRRLTGYEANFPGLDAKLAPEKVKTTSTTPLRRRFDCAVNCL